MRFCRSFCLQSNRIGSSLLFTVTLMLRKVIRGLLTQSLCVAGLFFVCFSTFYRFVDVGFLGIVCFARFLALLYEILCFAQK